MAIKFSRGSDELHPEGWGEFCIKGAEEAKGQFGPQIKWKLESKAKDEKGNRFPMTLWTSTTISAKSKLGELISACGIDLDEVDDTFEEDELLGKVIECKVVHKEGEKGVFANIAGMRERRQAAKARPAPKPADDDPFDDQ